MSFNCPFKTDNRAAVDAVAEYYDARGNTFEAECTRKYGDICDLGTSTWRSFISEVIDVCNGERLPVPADADTWTSPDYRVDAKRLKTCADIAVLMLNGCCAKYFREANDHYDGSWAPTPQYTDCFGVCTATNPEIINDNISRCIDEALTGAEPSYEILFDDETSGEANSVAWRKLAEYIADDENYGIGDATVVERGDAIAFAARCMSALYAFEVDSQDAVLIPANLMNRMRDELREFAGSDYYDYIDEFINAFTYNGWAIEQMAGLAEPLAIAIENGVTELIAMPG